jgi:hypothetical protein
MLLLLLLLLLLLGFFFFFFCRLCYKHVNTLPNGITLFSQNPYQRLFFFVLHLHVSTHLVWSHLDLYRFISSCLVSSCHIWICLFSFSSYFYHFGSSCLISSYLYLYCLVSSGFVMFHFFLTCLILSHLNLFSFILFSLFSSWIFLLPASSLFISTYIVLSHLDL